MTQEELEGDYLKCVALYFYAINVHFIVICTRMCIGIGIILDSSVASLQLLQCGRQSLKIEA